MKRCIFLLLGTLLSCTPQKSTDTNKPQRNALLKELISLEKKQIKALMNKNTDLEIHSKNEYYLIDSCLLKLAQNNAFDIFDKDLNGIFDSIGQLNCALYSEAFTEAVCSDTSMIHVPGPFTLQTIQKAPIDSLSKAALRHKRLTPSEAYGAPEGNIRFALYLDLHIKKQYAHDPLYRYIRKQVLNQRKDAIHSGEYVLDIIIWNDSVYYDDVAVGSLKEVTGRKRGSLMKAKEMKDKLAKKLLAYNREIIQNSDGTTSVLVSEEEFNQIKNYYSVFNTTPKKIAAPSAPKPGEEIVIYGDSLSTSDIIEILFNQTNYYHIERAFVSSGKSSAPFHFVYFKKLWLATEEGATLKHSDHSTTIVDTARGAAFMSIDTSISAARFLNLASELSNNGKIALTIDPLFQIKESDPPIDKIHLTTGAIVHPKSHVKLRYKVPPVSVFMDTVEAELMILD